MPDHQLIDVGGQTLVVDTTDAPTVAARNWAVLVKRGQPYVRSTGAEGVYLGRLLLKLGSARDDRRRVVHLNGDRLDFRRANLAAVGEADIRARSATTSRGGYRGVDQVKRTGKWRARGQYRGRRTDLGTYDSAEEAAAAYDDWALDTIGAGAAVNFPMGEHDGPARIDLPRAPLTGDDTPLVGDAPEL